VTATLFDKPPYQDEFEELDDQEQPTGFFSRAWLNFFDRLWARTAAGPRKLKRVTVVVTAVVGTTPFALGELAAGLYRVSWNGRVKTPAGATSSFQVTLGYTDGGVAQTFLGDVLNGNTTTTKESQSKVVRIDVGTAITYALAYASNPAAAMVGALDFLIEDLNG
jgi:hypothetical protein